MNSAAINWDKILLAYQLDLYHTSIKPVGNGLINSTWHLANEEDEYILQKINTAVFQNPVIIANNIQKIAAYLQVKHAAYLLVAPLTSLENTNLLYLKNEGYYRLFHYVKGSVTHQAVQQPKQAFEAARKFGEFTRLLSGFDVTDLDIPLRHFHDLSLRYIQFEAALETGNRKRIDQSKELIAFMMDQQLLVTQYEQITRNPAFKKRVTHHDTKISNVLFDADDNALCVIDLDTTMPGYFISDVGDMFRTYLSPVSEEEKELSLISIRDEYFDAIMQGYLQEMKYELTAEERTHLIYAGEFMMYMQALRFLTDHLMEDVYYGAAYKNHNYYRAQNQAKLLECFQQKKSVLHARLQVLLGS